MAEHDMPEAIGLMGAGLFLLNRELILELWRQEMESTSHQRPTAHEAVGLSLGGQTISPDFIDAEQRPPTR